jgi:hypothetical protein
VVRRVVRADVAADRAPVPDLDVSDLGADLAEDRARTRLGRAHDVRVGRHRPDREGSVGGELDALQVVEPVQIDEEVG